MTNPRRQHLPKPRAQSPESRARNQGLAAVLRGGFAAALLAGSVAVAMGAPLNESAALHFRPDDRSPVIAVVPAGTDPVLTADPLGATPTGWMAVKYNGPFDGFVLNGDLTKTLDVKPGSSIRVAPDPSAAVLTTMQAGDKTDLTGLRGKFTQIHVEKALVGYIRNPGAAGATAAASSEGLSAAEFARRSELVGASPPAASTAPAVSTAPMAPSPAAPPVLGPQADMPRVFQGKIVSTRRPLAPRRPYDYQLNDEGGSRLAYLDLSHLMQTANLESYLDQIVVVQGTAKNNPDLKAIVIAVESLQLK